MSDPITHPHDHYFKEIFTHKENAVDFVQHYLPQEVVKLLDVTTLEISKDSFVDSGAFPKYDKDSQVVLTLAD